MGVLSKAEELKWLTREQHQALEGRIVKIIRKAESIQDYHHLLRFFYGFFKPVESLALRFIDVNVLPDIGKRRKSGLLMKDLRALDGEIHPIPVTTHLPNIHNLTTAFAAFYVLEGSTIGGKHILTMLRQRIVLPGRDGVLFFTGYGDDTPGRWNAFRAVLNQQFTRQGDMEELSATANETFQAFSCWAEANYIYARKEKL